MPSPTRIISTISHHGCITGEGLCMLRRMVICLIIVGAGAPFAASSSARERRHIDVTPFSHAPCSVLSGECTPSTCSVFNHGPCIPEFYYPYFPYYPYGENLQVTIQSQPSQDDATKYQKPDHDLNTKHAVSFTSPRYDRRCYNSRIAFAASKTSSAVPWIFPSAHARKTRASASLLASTLSNSPQREKE
jgi:hypothetical protein